MEMILSDRVVEGRDNALPPFGAGELMEGIVPA